ncbi:MAG: peptidoglycan DD-metalloendopeptidase family protein [Oscillospiraceae bacterium]|nr:peptidoglycan DD-metalloendopeptidase family protein [Oscillospiraceae bacterium]
MFVKTKGKKILLFFMVFLLAFTHAAIYNIKPQAAATENDLQKQINDKKASLNATANKRKDLEKEIASLKNQKADAERDKRNYDYLIAIIESEIKDTEELVETIKEYMEQEETEIDDLQKKYEESYDIFLKIIKFAYEEGDVNYLNLLLDSENFTDFLSRMDIISNIFEYNKNAIDNLLQDKKTLENAKESHEEMIRQLDGYAEDLSEKSQEAAGYRKKAENAIAQLASDIKESEAKQAQFDQESANIQAEIARASKELQALQESQRKYVGGNFLYPVTPKYSPAVSSGFGTRISPITGRSEFHNGIDIPANYGSDIWAVNDGIVIISTYGTGYGNYIVIDHGGGKATLYAHASSLLKKVGDSVKKGDVIAKVGSTGWSTGNHLHFTYIEDGVFKNPLSQLG